MFEFDMNMLAYVHMCVSLIFGIIIAVWSIYNIKIEKYNENVIALNSYCRTTKSSASSTLNRKLPLHSNSNSKSSMKSFNYGMKTSSGDTMIEDSNNQTKKLNNVEITVPKQHKKVTQRKTKRNIHYRIRRLVVFIGIALFLYGLLRLFGLQNNALYFTAILIAYYITVIIEFCCFLVCFAILTVLKRSIGFVTASEFVRGSLELSAFLIIVIPLITNIWGAIIDREWPTYFFFIFSAIFMFVWMCLVLHSFRQINQFIKKNNRRKQQSTTSEQFKRTKRFVGSGICIVLIAVPMQMMSGVIGLTDFDEKYFLHGEQDVVKWPSLTYLILIIGASIVFLSWSMEKRVTITNMK